jgi:hypothetical protein
MISFTNITASSAALGWQHHNIQIQQISTSGVVDGDQKAALFTGRMAARAIYRPEEPAPYAAMQPFLNMYR